MQKHNITLENIKYFSYKTKVACLEMVHRSGASHIGSCLSSADILSTLYTEILNVFPSDPENSYRDIFILSKGHAAAILYAVLAEKGFFPKSWLNDYACNGSLLLGHASHLVPGVEVSTGSLGHGLPIACGMAMARRKDNNPSKVFVLLSDGELNEGSNWESFLFAPHHRLSNLTVLVDYNKIQSFGYTNQILNLEPLGLKFQSFGWYVSEVDGHNIEQLLYALKNTRHCEIDRPHIIICNTVKGKGVSFMEDKLEWHYKSPNNDELEQALAELKLYHETNIY